MNLNITARRLSSLSLTPLPRLVVFWVASIDGTHDTFRGRTKAEAMGRALLHLLKLQDAEAESANREGGAN